MRKEERARHANTSASSFQPKQNPQQTELVRKETGIEAETLGEGEEKRHAGGGRGLGRRWRLEVLEALG